MPKRPARNVTDHPGEAVADRVKIARLTARDLPDLIDLYQQLQPTQADPRRTRAAFARIRRRRHQVFLGAHHAGRLVGTVLAVTCQMLYGPCRSFAVVEDVVVAERHRGHGIGTALMAAIEHWAQDRDCSYIMLMTDHDRPRSRRFYAGLGYEHRPYVGFKKRL